MFNLFCCLFKKAMTKCLNSAKSSGNMCHQLTRTTRKTRDTQNAQQPQLSPSAVAARLAGHREYTAGDAQERATMPKSKRSQHDPHIRVNENLLCSSNSLDDHVVVVVVVGIVIVNAALRHVSTENVIPILSRKSSSCFSGLERVPSVRVLNFWPANGSNFIHNSRIRGFEVVEPQELPYHGLMISPYNRINRASKLTIRGQFRSLFAIS